MTPPSLNIHFQKSKITFTLIMFIENKKNYLNKSDLSMNYKRFFNCNSTLLPAQRKEKSNYFEHSDMKFTTSISIVFINR